MNKYFYCYSYPLKEFFKQNGLRYITAATNQMTHKTYWLFEGTEKLKIAAHPKFRVCGLVILDKK